MYRPTVTIKGCCKWTDAEANYGSEEIRLNLLLCEQYAEECKIEFHEYIARCVNHEFLHHLLHEEQNYETSGALDNIAERLKDFWLW